jgi:hypothetical protein
MKIRIISFLLLFLIAGSACHTDEDINEEKTQTEEPGTDRPSPDEEDVTVETSGIEISPDAVAVLSDEWTKNISVLDSTSYRLQISENLIEKHNLHTGSILVTNQGDGLLRRIKSIGAATNGKVTVETEFCTLEELINEGSFRFTVNQSALRSSINISKTNTWSLKYDSNIADIYGKYTFGTTVDFSISFKNSQFQNVSLLWRFIDKLELNAGIKVSGKIKNKLFQKRLPRITVPVGGAPVTIVPIITLYIGGEITGKPGPVDFNFTSGFSVAAGISYDGALHPSAKWECSQTFEKPELVLNDKLSAKLKVYIEPVLEFRIYGVLSPYFTINAYGQIEAGYTKNPAWTASVGAELSGGIKAQIFTRKLFDVKTSFYNVKIPVLYAENNLSVSPEHQWGIAGKKLPDPFVAKVTNAFGYPLSGYRVKFENKSGYGQLSRTEVTTNKDGEASVELTLSKYKYEMSHTLEASAIEKNETPYKDEPLKNSPVEFTASIWGEVMEYTTWEFELESKNSRGKTSIRCQLKDNGIAQIGSIEGTWKRIGNSLTVYWVQVPQRPTGCTYQLEATINGTVCSGSYTHWDYDEKNTQSVWDSGTLSGRLVSAEDK